MNFVRDGLVETRDSEDGTAQLIAGVCPACGHVAFPFQPTCPACPAGQMSDGRLGPAGVLWSFTGVHHPVPGGKVMPPYAVALAEFAPGVLVTGLLTVPDVTGLAVGDPVEVVVAEAFREDDGTVLTYKFRPTAPAGRA